MVEELKAILRLLDQAMLMQDNDHNIVVWFSRDQFDILRYIVDDIINTVGIAEILTKEKEGAMDD